MIDAARTDPGTTCGPEVVIIGDSHAIALKHGCDALGIPAVLLSVSGNFWHAGRVVFDAERGIRMRGNRDLDAASERILRRFDGQPILGRERPVLVSAGFQLGRLVPRLSATRHVSEAGNFAADPAALHLSSEFLLAYVQEHREPQMRLLRRIARRSRATIVAPPPLFNRPNMRGAYLAVCERMRALRLNLYEPWRDLSGPGEALDRDYFAEDGIHGNVRYGTAVIERLVARGALAPRPA